MKYTKNFNRDWDFYLNHSDMFTFSGASPKVFEYDPDGPDAKETFYRWESDCVLVPTKEPELLQRIHITKGSVNFHIRQWVEGFEDFMEPIEFYLESFTNPPKWVRKALEGSLVRKYGERCLGWYR